MLIKLGDAIVDSDEILYAMPTGDDMHIEILFKSRSRFFGHGKKVIVHATNPAADLSRIDPMYSKVIVRQCA